MLKAFIDESGIHDGSEVCVVAGFWAKTGPWRRFDSKWRRVLRDFNVPLEEFHAKDAVKKTGFFLPWTRENSNNFLTELGLGIGSSGVHPVCWALYVNEFLSLTLAERKFLTGGTWNAEKRDFQSTGSPNKPYFVCFTECVKLITAYVSAPNKVNFSFGCDRPTSAYADQLFRYWRWRNKVSASLGVRRRLSVPSPNKHGLVSFPYAKDTPALQAADLLAYLTYNFMKDHRRDDLMAVPGEPLLGMLKNRKRNEDTQWRSGELMRQIIQSAVPNFPTD